MKGVGLIKYRKGFCLLLHANPSMDRVNCCIYVGFISKVFWVNLFMSKGRRADQSKDENEKVGNVGLLWCLVILFISMVSSVIWVMSAMEIDLKKKTGRPGGRRLRQ